MTPGNVYWLDKNIFSIEYNRRVSITTDRKIIEHLKSNKY